MMSRPSIRIACIALAIALAAWVGAFFFHRAIVQRDSDTAKAISNARQANMSEDSRNQLLAVFTATESGRQHINGLLNIDFLSLADALVAAGSDAGVVLRVSNATPESLPLQDKGAASSLSAIQFTVESDGTFTKLLNALALLETLPLPSQVEDVSFDHTDGKPDQPWNMKVRLRILTNLSTNS